MSSRFATERVVLEQDDLVDPRSGKRSGCSWNGRMARRQRRTLPRTTLPANSHGAARSESPSSGGRTERVYEDPKGELGLDTTGPLLPRLEPPCVHGAVCFAFIVAERSRLFPPRPEKLPRGKRSHRHDGADGNPPGAALPGFLHHCAPGRRARPGHCYPMPPVSQTAIDGTAWCNMPVNTDGRLPF